MTGIDHSSKGSATARYVIITPAYNEEHYICRAIESVVHQTLQPLRWLIVDDGSTDDTGRIVDRAATEHPFITRHFRKKQPDETYFASNVQAIMEGYRLLESKDFEFLAILDADIVLPPDYYQTIIPHFDADPTLGVASGIYDNLVDGKLQKKLLDRRSTPKAIQVFKKEVFDAIGGFLPLKYGGEDTISCVMARMHGWKVWSFPDIKVVHLRPTGTGGTKSLLRVRYRQGITQYHVAAHPLFVFLKCLRLMVREPPYIIGGCAHLAGYTKALLCREPIVLPDEVKEKVRQEHLERVMTLNRIQN